MRRALAAGISLLAAAPAVADPADPAQLAPFAVTGRLDADVARFAVRYVLQTEHAESSTTAPLPDHGVVVAATVAAKGRRHTLQLVAAEAASAQFAALFEAKVGPSQRWAISLDADTHNDQFSVTTAAPRSAALVLDVEISAPTCFHDDARYVAVPASWRARVPNLLVRDKHAVALQAACHELVGDSVWARFPTRQLAKRRGGAERVGTFANRVALGRQQVVKLEVDLAGRLSEVPADLATVLVIDASRSMTTAELEGQRQTVAAYLRAAPNSRVQVIAYAREPRPLLPAWMTARQAAPHLDRALRALVRANGSNLDAGLRAAGQWLDQIKGTRRIVLFTDERLPSRIERAAVLDDALPPRTLVHTVAFGGLALERDDEALLARLAARTRGMSVRGANVAEDERLVDATMLVRPTMLDRVVVRAPGWKQLATQDHSCPEGGAIAPTSFAEGEACTWWGQAAAMSAPLTVEGFLWGERVVRVVRADLDRARDVARELSMLHVLDEELQLLAERAARAVNTVWSLYAAWGGDDGYEDGVMFGRAGFGISCGTCGGDFTDTGIGVMGGHGPELTAELTRIVNTCKPDHRIDVEVETTFEEIVEVSVTTDSATTRTCVEHALWNAWLNVPRAPGRIVTTLHVGPA